MKYARIDRHRPEYGLAEMCGVLDVSVRGYRSWKRGGTLSRNRLTDVQMLALIKVIHAVEMKAPVVELLFHPDTYSSGI